MGWIVVLLSPALLAAQADVRARELVRSGQPLQAIPIYEELLRTDPHNTTLLINLVVAHFKAAQYARVIELCRGREDLIPAQLFLGASYIELGRPADAVGPLGKVVAAEPGERNARLMLGEALLATEREAEAVPHFERAARLMPDEPRAWYGLYRASTALARREEQAPGGSALAHAFTGDAAFRTGRHGLALHHYRQALALDPSLTEVHAAIADVYAATGHGEWGAREAQLARPDGRYTRARELRRRAADAFARLESLPPSIQLHELRARRLEESARFREAAAEWRSALALAPQNGAIRRALASSLLNARDHKPAVELLDELLRETSPAPEVHLLYGRALLETGEPEAAVSHLQRADALPGARELLGAALLQAGRAAEAVPHLEAGLAGDADGSRHFQLARALQASGDPERARQTMREYTRLREAAEERRKEIERDYPITAPPRPARGSSSRSRAPE